MILLLTGQPGHGKTAYGLTRARELAAKGRRVYAHGVRDLDYEKIGFQHIQEPAEWEQLPDGSVILLDECYTTFPARNPGAKVPPHVEAMARHRHRGFDFILIAQQGLQLDPFLRGLVEEHIHVRKQWGTRKTNLKKWDRYQNNTNGKSADTVTWIRDKEIFNFYTSTTLDTNSIRIPQWAKYLVGAVVLVFVLLYVFKLRTAQKIEEFTAERAGVAAPPHSVASASGAATPAVTTPATPAEYAARALPRLDAVPWSAPLYDGRPVVADPLIACMSSDPGTDASGRHQVASCNCITEQGTRYLTDDAVCRDIARYGPPYNPFKRPASDPVQPPSIDGAAPVATATAPGVLIPRTSDVKPYGDVQITTPDQPFVHPYRPLQ